MSSDLFDDEGGSDDVTDDSVAKAVPSRAEYLRESVEMDDVTQLDDAMRRLSGDLSYWNNQYAQSHKKFNRLKVETDKLHGRMYMMHRASLMNEHGKATEPMIKAAVDMDEDYHDIKIELVDAEAEKIRLKGVCESVVAKKDMLQSIGAKLRIEMGHDPSIRNMAASARNASG